MTSPCLPLSSPPRPHPHPPTAPPRVPDLRPPLGWMFLAGGMSAWGSYLTPFQSGAAPMMVYTMRRYGIPVPVAVTSTLMTFVATVIFFAIAGPFAILLGAGHSLGSKGD